MYKIINILCIIYLLIYNNIVFADNYKPNNILIDRVDLVENNFFYDENGRLVFQQIIWMDWSWNENRYNVRAWRLVKDETNGLIPKKNWNINKYVSLWIDGDKIRKIISEEIRETHYQFDVELLEREFLPKEKRKGLNKE